MSPSEVGDEMARVGGDFRGIIGGASRDGLRRRSDGTRWPNRQLLFHMVLGYLVVRTVLPLVRVLGRLGHSRAFAATLNAGHRPFHVINYAGVLCGRADPDYARHGRIARPDPARIATQPLRRDRHGPGVTVHFPTAWDPYFTPTMSVLDVYHFATQHFDHHRRQLTLRER